MTAGTPVEVRFQIGPDISRLRSALMPVATSAWVTAGSMSARISREAVTDASTVEPRTGTAEIHWQVVMRRR